MNKGFVFALGAAVGSAITWFVMDRKLVLKDMELSDMRDYYREKISDVEDDIEENLEEGNKLVKELYSQEIGKMGYNNVKKAESKEEEQDYPYVISPDEFGENNGYEKQSMVLYADGVLTTISDDIVENPDDWIGEEENLSRFGEFEEDVLYIRNNKYQTDIEVSRDYSTYNEEG